MKLPELKEKLKSKYIVRVVAGVLTIALVGTGIGATAVFAEKNSTAVTAEADSTTGSSKDADDIADKLMDSVSLKDNDADKDESVYLISDANGNVNKTIVVDHLKNKDKKDTLEDASNLSDIENVKGKEKFTQSGDKLTWQAGGKDIYYQGTATEEPPVTQKVTYYLDGKEISPEDLAGKSGKVKIRFDYTNTTSYTETVNGEKQTVSVPFAAITGLVLGDGFENIEVTNGKAEVSDSSSVVLGYALPGLKDSLGIKDKDLDGDVNIPEYMEMTADVENFSMPAGYIDDKKDDQWLVKVGENYTNAKQLKKMVLTSIKGIGKIKLSDVADIVTIDNEGESYAKLNGEDALLLSAFKASTASTSTVSTNLKSSFKELEKQYDGLTITPLMDQGEYIDIIVKSILSSILLGAILAIIVLALFLKDVKPTLVVAFSIPFSVLFAIIIMYFTNITLNVMSLAGLCLGIGMLVDNSIVVIENVYRLRNRGISAPRAAVQGAKQVAGAIIASTLTTICVFLPMVYTSGTVSQLMIPFAFTISYALIASLIVALTVVPTISSVVLRKTKEQNHRFFDKVKEKYEVALEFQLYCWQSVLQKCLVQDLY